MTKKSRIELLADSVALAMKSMVAAAEKRIMSAVTKQFEALPPARDGRDGRDLTRDDALAAARLAVGELNLRSGEDGKDGKDAEPVDVKSVADLVLPALVEQVEKAAASIPSLIEEGLAQKVADLPKPAPAEKGEKGEPGEAPSAEAVAAVVLPVVERAALYAVAKIAPPVNGKDGADADPEVVAAKLMPVIEQRLAEAVAALPTPARGENGRDGIDGKSIEPEQVLAMVKAAVAEVPEPRDGRDGQPGRDALQIEVLPAIDEKRAYPRATFAQHKGGIWRTHKTSEGLTGWECVVNGVDSIEVRQAEDDPRQFVVVTSFADGHVKETPLYIPAVVDQGLYKEGRDYRKGDGVTWARHYWIARTDTKAKPDFGDDWRLAVKSGRDGKDGKDGKP